MLALLAWQQQLACIRCATLCIRCRLLTDGTEASSRQLFEQKCSGSNPARREGCSCTVLYCSLVCQWLFLRARPVYVKRAQLSAFGAMPGEGWMHWGCLASSGSTHCHLKGIQHDTHGSRFCPDNTVLQVNSSLLQQP